MWHAQVAGTFGQAVRGTRDGHVNPLNSSRVRCALQCKVGCLQAEIIGLIFYAACILKRSPFFTGLYWEELVAMETGPAYPVCIWHACLHFQYQFPPVPTLLFTCVFRSRFFFNMQLNASHKDKHQIYLQFNNRKNK